MAKIIDFNKWKEDRAKKKLDSATKEYFNVFNQLNDFNRIKLEEFKYRTLSALHKLKMFYMDQQDNCLDDMMILTGKVQTELFKLMFWATLMFCSFGGIMFYIGVIEDKPVLLSVLIAVISCVICFAFALKCDTYSLYKKQLKRTEERLNDWKALTEKTQSDIDKLTGDS